MTQTRARQILQSLIKGMDPVTGEELPRETVLQHADVLRALLAGLCALEQTAARAQRRAQLPDNVGQAWTTEEESRLLAAFKAGDSPVAIAHKHDRTLRAIEARLEKLGLITAEQRTTRGGAAVAPDTSAAHLSDVEFAVLLPHASSDRAEEIARAIQRASEPLGHDPGQATRNFELGYLSLQSTEGVCRCA